MKTVTLEYHEVELIQELTQERMRGLKSGEIIPPESIEGAIEDCEHLLAKLES
jgi:hypothetical protein